MARMVRDEKPRTVYWLDDKLYLNITNQCSNKCIFCIRNFKRGIDNFMLKLKTEPSFKQVKDELEVVMHRKAWKEIIFCGFGEPTARLDLLSDLARWIQKNLPGVPIRVNTNGHGYKLNTGRDVAKELKDAGVNKVSVSLNAGDEVTYNEICKPAFSGAFLSVLEFIEKAKHILDIEVTAVTNPEVKMYEVEALAKRIGVKLRIRQCTPCFW